MTQSYVVRYGRMRSLSVFTGIAGQDHPRGQAVVVQGERGVELGEVLSQATPKTEAALKSTVTGAILREATEQDHELMSKLTTSHTSAFSTCRELIRKRKLQMELVDVETILGQERITFYYLAEMRVDFRELVKDLAKAFRTRIEMRQIGVRDEAKLLADYGDCGKPVCCNTHLTKMPTVSMKMAKLQKTTLDPAKISGRCGRLKCCLRFEYDTYQELEKLLPPLGSTVSSPKGVGRVVAHEILVLKVMVEFEDRRRLLIDLDDVEIVAYPKKRAPLRASDDLDPESTPLASSEADELDPSDSSNG